ncbi:MAG: helix-turn-helix domain-containing protein [Bryobacteraceae bacterium]|nr:helix-turn-helix domain-containing protein [Bryobacteraceae bacterium]
MTPLPPDRKLLTIAQLGEVLGVSYARAADIIRRSLIPAVRIGRQVRVSPDALNAFIEAGGYKLDGGWKRDA